MKMPAAPRILLYQSYPMECPYLPGQIWVTQSFQTNGLSPAFFEHLLSQGFRRSGETIYRQHCPNCRACVPIRIDIRRFAPSKSQRRVLSKNHDVTVTRSLAEFEQADFDLYQRYVDTRHPSHETPDEDGYVNFLILSPVQTEIMRYYIADRLVGVAWMDAQPHSLSSVYCAFDPDFSARSLGTFSILRQIRLGQELGKEWVYLGFWVEQSRKMSYKSRFSASQILENQAWRPLEGRAGFAPEVFA